MSDLRVIFLVNFLSNACLYEFYFGVTEVLFVEFNKVFILLFSATIGTVPHRHSVHP